MRTRTLVAKPKLQGSKKRFEDNDNKERDEPFRKPPQSISNPDYWVRKSNARKLTKLGKFFKHALDPLVLPVVDRPGGWLLVSVGLFVVLLVGQLYAGKLFKTIYPFFGPEFQRTGEDDGLPFLQPFYELSKWILGSRLTGPFPASHPVIPSIVAIYSYLIFVFGFTVLDIFGHSMGFVQQSTLQPRKTSGTASEAKTFSSRHFGPGFLRAVKSHSFMLLVCVIQYSIGSIKKGPHIYQPPWFEVCYQDCDAPLPERAPTIIEFCATLLFCLITMDIGYAYWHFMAHRYKAVYRNVHAWHHEYHSPFAMVSQHLHPIEICVTGGFSVVGPVACGAHPFTFWVWLVVSVWLSVDAHSGYDCAKMVGSFLPSRVGQAVEKILDPNWLTCGLVARASHHDEHHRKPCGNYAPFLVCLDKLWGTDLED